MQMYHRSHYAKNRDHIRQRRALSEALTGRRVELKRLKAEASLKALSPLDYYIQTLTE
jgi:cytochrome P450